MTDTTPRIRLDKWLWHARFYKTRSLAAKVVGQGDVRVNANRVTKPAHNVIPGDVLTFGKERQVFVVRIKALGERRGPAPEAQALYDDLSPPPEPRAPQAPKYDGNRFETGGRPTKRDRRVLDDARDAASRRLE